MNTLCYLQSCCPCVCLTPNGNNEMYRVDFKYSKLERMKSDGRSVCWVKQYFRPVTSHLKTGIVFLKLWNVDLFSPLPSPSLSSPLVSLLIPSPLAFEVDHWNPARGLASGERCKFPQRKSNLVHFSFKTMISWDSTDQIPYSFHCYLHFTCETKRTFAPFAHGWKGSSTRSNPSSHPVTASI